MTKIKCIGLCLVVISIFFIALSLLRKKDTFFNLRKVIIDHLKLFKDCKAQYFVFYGLPLVFSVGLAILYTAGATFYSELSVILGILLSMMLAILSILSGFDFSHRSEAENNRAYKVVNETINAIIFDSVLCIFLMIYGLIIIVLEGASLPKLPINVAIIKAILSGAAYYIFTVILLNLLLIIKHMSNIIKYRMIIKKEEKNDTTGA